MIEKFRAFQNIYIVYLFCLMWGILLNCPVNAQTPNKIHHQTMIYYNGVLVASKRVGMQISILKDSVNGIAVYTEKQTPVSNSVGIVDFIIGGEDSKQISGSLSNIEWASGKYFLKTEIDTEGGTNYNIIVITQLVSIPYALHAKSAEVLTGNIPEVDPKFHNSVAGGITRTDTSNWRKLVKQHEHYVGELYGGGIVFWVTSDAKHGLVASLFDLDKGNKMQWSSNTANSIPGAKNSFDGESNTEAIVSDSKLNGYAAITCYNYSIGEYDDWYLPANQELVLLINSCYIINKVLDEDNNPATHGLVIPNNQKGMYGEYWSSTEFVPNAAWHTALLRNTMDNDRKDTKKRVRAVRKF